MRVSASPDLSALSMSIFRKVSIPPPVPRVVQSCE
jgi:hypothetical protein